jgi:hypothetical protein
MSYQLICNIPPEADGTCLSQSWVPISDLAQITMQDANTLFMIAFTGIILALTFRWALKLIYR